MQRPQRLEQLHGDAEVDMDPYRPASERRRHPRVSNPGLSGRVPRATTGRLRDLSLSGVGFESEARLAPARTYRLRIATADGEEIERQGRLVWSRLYSTHRGPNDEVIPVYRAGLMFEDRSVTAASDLYEMIQRSGAIGGNGDGDGDGDATMPRFPVERHATRYQMREVEEVALETDYGFLVRNLSLSGMLIETDIVLRRKEQVELVLELPGGEIRARGRVVKTERSFDGERQRYSVALEFLRLPEGERLRLQEYLQRFLQ